MQLVERYYGNTLTIEWLKIQLQHTFSLCGFDFMLGNDSTVQIVATEIYNNYHYLKIGEIALFLSDFEKGVLGDFNTRFNSQKFFTALRCWLKIRADLKIQLDDKLKQQEREQRTTNAVPCPDDLEIAKYFVQNYK